jgi:hypothetical protein
VMTPWREFREIPEEAFHRTGARLTVIDCWRVIPSTVAAAADVVYLGRGEARNQPVRA